MQSIYVLMLCFLAPRNCALDKEVDVVLYDIHCALQSMTNTVAVPQSIPGLVTKRLLVMTFLEGEQITRLKVNGAVLCPT